MSRPMLGDGMHVARNQTEVCCLSGGRNETKPRRKCTLQQTCVSYPITKALKSVPVERDWACDAYGASRQDMMVFARLL